MARCDRILRLELGSTLRRDRENSSGNYEPKEVTAYVSFDWCIDASSHRSDSNYSKTSPRASERSILILLNYWYLTRISIALLGNGVIQTRRNTIYRLFSKLILFYPRWNKWITRFDKFKKKKHLSNLICYRFNRKRNSNDELFDIWKIFKKFWLIQYYRSFW